MLDIHPKQEGVTWLPRTLANSCLGGYLVSPSVLSRVHPCHIFGNVGADVLSACHHSLPHSFVENRRFGGFQGLQRPGYETVQSAQFTAGVDNM